MFRQRVTQQLEENVSVLSYARSRRLLLWMLWDMRDVELQVACGLLCGTD
jgi:hypothetical protein